MHWLLANNKYVHWTQCLLVVKDWWFTYKAFAKNKYFSTFDLKNAYYKVKLKSFEANGWIYQFPWLPFRVTNAFPTFQWSRKEKNSNPNP